MDFIIFWCFDGWRLDEVIATPDAESRKESADKAKTNADANNSTLADNALAAVIILI